MNVHPIRWSPMRTQVLPVGDYKRAGGFKGVRGLIARKGGEPEEILQRFGITSSLLDDPDNYISYSAMIRVFEYCAERFEEPYFGFELAKTQAPDVTGPLAALLLASPTVGEGLSLVTRYMAVLAPGAKLSLDIDTKEAQLSYQINATSVRFHRQINEFSMALCYNTILAIVGGSFRLNHVEIASTAPPSHSPNPLPRFFGVPVQYDSMVSNIRFTNAYLDQRIDTSNPTLLRFAQAQCDALIPHDMGLEQQIAMQVRQLLPLGGAALPMVAQRLMIHPRSLQNRLAALGIEFRDILQNERQALAKAYLAEMRIPIAEIAYLVGYADQATFTRAFTKWTGLSPSRFRHIKVSPAYTEPPLNNGVNATY